MDRRTETAFDSREWDCMDPEGAAKEFMTLGFRNTGEVLPLRVYDLLNLNGISFYKADRMLKALYGYLNPNTVVDRLMDYGELDQPFSFGEWKRRHPKARDVTVADLVLAEDINRRALEKLLDRTVKRFYRSGEYNSREYRYYSFGDLKRSLEVDNGEGKTEDKEEGQ